MIDNKTIILGLTIAIVLFLATIVFVVSFLDTYNIKAIYLGISYIVAFIIVIAIVKNEPKG